MDSKSTGLIYRVDDFPPWGSTVLLASQHMIISVSYSIFAVLVMREIGASSQEIQNVTAMALIAAGLGVILQSLKKGPVGSGYLAAHVSSAIYIPASLAAGAAGGPALIWGMTLAAGAFEALLSRVFSKLRVVFPPVVCGVVIVMVGFSLIRVALERFLGLAPGDTITEFREVFVSGITLAGLVGLSVWGWGRLRLYCLLLSIAAGCGVAIFTGILGEKELEEIAKAPWFALPRPFHHGWSFDSDFLGPFLVAALAAAAKTSGLIVTLQGVNHPKQKQPDMKNVSRGILADALGTVTCGLLGTIGTNLSPTSVSLNSATGASSRIISRVTGGLVLAMGLSPKVAIFISMLPGPVMGAVLIYAVCIISFSGLKLIMSGTPDNRVTYLVGLSLLAGLGAEIVPNLYDKLPHFIELVFHSSITVTAVVAIALNLIFLLGRPQEKMDT